MAADKRWKRVGLISGPTNTFLGRWQLRRCGTKYRVFDLDHNGWITPGPSFGRLADGKSWVTATYGGRR